MAAGAVMAAPLAVLGILVEILQLLANRLGSVFDVMTGVAVAAAGQALFAFVGRQSRLLPYSSRPVVQFRRLLTSKRIRGEWIQPRSTPCSKRRWICARDRSRRRGDMAGHACWQRSLQNAKVLPASL